MRIYFRDHILPRVPDRLKAGLHFEELYDAFGGKLAHWHDYAAEYSELAALFTLSSIYVGSQ